MARKGSDLLDDLDELTDDSVSSCSDSSGSVSLGSVDITEPGKPRKPSDVSQEPTLKKVKSKKRMSKNDNQNSMQDPKYLSGPLNPTHKASTALPNFSLEKPMP